MSAGLRVLSFLPRNGVVGARLSPDPPPAEAANTVAMAQLRPRGDKKLAEKRPDGQVGGLVSAFKCEPPVSSTTTTY